MANRVKTGTASGPSSYDPSSQPSVAVPGLSKIVDVNDVETVEIDGGYQAEPVSVSQNDVTVKVLYAQYSKSTDGTLTEIVSGTDISSQTIRVTASGH